MGKCVKYGGNVRMKNEIYQSIKVLVKNDDTITPDHRREILRVCRNGEKRALQRLGTAKQAAQLLDCHIKTIRRYAKKGSLHPIRHSSRRLRFDMDEVEKFAGQGLPDKRTDNFDQRSEAD